MAVKSAQGAEERDWREYDRAYVRSIGVADGDVEEAAAVLGHTRIAALWRWPIPDSMAALRRARRRRRAARRGLQRVAGRSRPCCGGRGSARSGRRGVAVRCVVDSHVVGVAKPDPAIFDHAAAHFPGVDRDAIAYVGDSVTMDVAGASRRRPPPDPPRPLRRPPGRRLRPHPSLADLVLTSECQRSNPSRQRAMPQTLGWRQPVRRRAITLRQSVSSAPSKIDSTRASTNRRLTAYSSA